MMSYKGQSETPITDAMLRDEPIYDAVHDPFMAELAAADCVAAYQATSDHGGLVSASAQENESNFFDDIDDYGQGRVAAIDTDTVLDGGLLETNDICMADYMTDAEMHHRDERSMHLCDEMGESIAQDYAGPLLTAGEGPDAQGIAALGEEMVLNDKSESSSSSFSLSSPSPLSCIDRRLSTMRTPRAIDSSVDLRVPLSPISTQQSQSTPPSALHRQRPQRQCVPQCVPRRTRQSRPTTQC